MTKLIGGRYALERQIAKGALASLWRGEAYGAEGFARPVAVRVLDEPRDATFVPRWARIASELSAIGSPRIEAVLDVAVDSERTLVVSEWIEGVSLWRLSQAFPRSERPLPWPLAASILLDVLGALADAGERVHGCIDLRSVRLSRLGVAKLLRFGVSEALEGEDRRTLERHGLRHPAPELIAGGRPSAATDRFGVGALFFELLAGEPAFPPVGEARDRAVEAGDIADLTVMRPDVPELLVALIERALRPEPEERFDSHEAMAGALVQVLNAEGQSYGPEWIASEVEALGVSFSPPNAVSSPKAIAPERPRGLEAARTLHVDLAELSPLSETSQPQASVEPRPRYRFGYKERRATLAARRTSRPALPTQPSEAAPLPLTRRVQGARPGGLSPQKTELLDGDEIERLIVRESED